jgi:hypothetical protein
MEVRWQTEDGYCGGSRPQYVTIDSSEIESHMSDDALERLLEDIVQDDFEQRVSFCINNREHVLKWMRECRDACKREEGQ